MLEDYLDVTSHIPLDESVVQFNYHSYVPHNTLAINNSDEIRIAINNQDILTLPSRSYLYIKGEIENHDKGHFVMNGLAFLFDEIKYLIANKEVDMIRNPGVATLMKLLCSTNKITKYSNAAFGDDANLKKIHKDGKFSGCIPMEMLMGVFQDFNKVLVNVKQELVLKRSKDDNNCCLTTSAVPAAGAVDPSPKIKLTAIQWVMPHVTPSDSEKLSLQKLMLQNKMLQIAFRSFEIHEFPMFPKTTKHTWAVKTTGQLEKPRYIIFAFQTERDGKPRKRSDNFDNCGLTNLKVFLNSESYPHDDLNANFTEHEVSKAYEMFIRFRESYYNLRPDPIMSRVDFMEKYPLIVVDVSKQNEAIKQGVVDLKLEIQSSANIPDNTTAYCLVIHDKLFEYNPVTNEINKL